MRTETRVSGGGVTVDRSAAYWAGWEHPFSFNPHGRAIEAAELHELEDVLPQQAARAVYDHFHTGADTPEKQK